MTTSTGMLRAGGVTLVLVVIGCASGRGTVPDLTPEAIAHGEEQGFSAAFLAHGRELFGARCAHCHVLPDVDSFSRPKWEAILPRMERKSRLEPEQASAVRAYVLAARRPDP